MGEKQQKLEIQSDALETPLLPQPVQNELFSVDDYECSKQMVSAYEAKPGQFSGKILERQKELVDNILERAVAGWSILQISKTFKVSRNSVSALIQRAEIDGRIQSYEKQLEEQLKHNVMLSNDVIRERLEQGGMKDKDLIMFMGIGTDKLFTLMGKATSRVEHSFKDNSSYFNDSIMALVEEGKKLLAEKDAAIDVESEPDIQGVQADSVPSNTGN